MSSWVDRMTRDWDISTEHIVMSDETAWLLTYR